MWDFGIFTEHRMGREADKKNKVSGLRESRLVFLKPCLHYQGCKMTAVCAVRHISFLYFSVYSHSLPNVRANVCLHKKKKL